MRILTFDIEDWFHILDNDSTRTEREWNNFESRIDQGLDRILALLDRKQVRATFFCLGWVARKYPEIIKRIDNCGYEIASHSDMHQLAYEQNRNEYYDDLRRSINSIENVIGKKIRAYRAPGFSIKAENKWALEILINQGIEIDCSIFPASRAHGGFTSFGRSVPCLIDINGSSLKEFPINVSEIMGKSFIFSGGGYFRFLPYKVIKSLTKRSEYVMTYFHPRDFDPEQPIIKDLSIFRKFKSYYGLKSSLQKLEQLMDEFNFIDLAAAEESVNWEKAFRVEV